MSDRILTKTGLEKLTEYIKPDSDFDVDSIRPVQNSVLTQTFADTLSTINNLKAIDYTHFSTVDALPTANSLVTNEVYIVGQRAIIDNSGEVYEVTAIDSDNNITWTKMDVNFGGGKVNAIALADSDAIATADDGFYYNVADNKVYEVMNGVVAESSQEIEHCIIDHNLYEENKDTLSLLDIFWVKIGGVGDIAESDLEQRLMTAESNIEAIQAEIDEGILIETETYPDVVKNKMYNVSKTTTFSVGKLFSDIISALNTSDGDNKVFLDKLSDYPLTGDVAYKDENWGTRIQGMIIFTKPLTLEGTYNTGSATVNPGTITYLYIREGEWNSGSYDEAYFIYSDGSHSATLTTGNWINDRQQFISFSTGNVYSKNIELVTQEQLSTLQTWSDWKDLTFIANTSIFAVDRNNIRYKENRLLNMILLQIQMRVSITAGTSITNADYGQLDSSLASWKLMSDIDYLNIDGYFRADNGSVNFLLGKDYHIWAKAMNQISTSNYDINITSLVPVEWKY